MVTLLFRSLVVFGMVGALLGSDMRSAAAQDPDRVGVDRAALDSVRRRIDFIAPTSGPPGTMVTLRTGGLPAVTPVRIGVGAIRFGFEEVAQLMTSDRGEIELTVEVPAWAQRDLTHVFIVFNFYFAPIALSDVFHVTGPDGTVQREGRIATVESPCSTMQGNDGVTYTLTGDLSAFAAGHEVIVEGTIAHAAGCDATTIRVVRIRHST